MFQLGILDGFGLQDTTLPFPDATSNLLDKFNLKKLSTHLAVNTGKYKKLHLTNLVLLTLPSCMHLSPVNLLLV